ncbi:uroporphyrinogen decarboxylase family protein [Petroclostridium xylanilyticum]|jgi:uroporphyrinogen decarboxylase|uniref:uroporphyrinogen decarboxylase family protein n=1 Tax=Petroclostridium xylanilyticum TaxID=1792311 RepID=UPI000B98BC51|nr:uroporphyrinogen decarboxylase family protein [Petroclostridium xylanilyticum]
MLDVDIEKFWADDELAHEENCFSSKAPQVALGIRMSEECVFAELGEKGNPWGYMPRERRIELNKRYNDKAEKIVGRRLLPEDFPEPDAVFPPIRRIGEVFEGRYVYNGISEWLEGSCNTPKELEKMLDHVEKLNLREFILPPNWESEKKRIYEKYGKKPELMRHVRGPVTLATSIYGVENLIFLILDEPDLAKRFSQVISDVIFGIATIMDEEAGYEPGKAPGGFSFADDNCCLLTPEMYELFGFPILKRIFDHWCPKPEDNRYQHSDSAMAHLLPILGRLNLTGCNFGPTVLVDEIRKYMPRTRIDGCLAPFTFMSNDEKAIIAEVKRDCEMARECRGLNISTAGSINNGSLLTSMRAVMYAIQNFGRY